MGEHVRNRSVARMELRREPVDKALDDCERSAVARSGPDQLVGGGWSLISSEDSRRMSCARVDSSGHYRRSLPDLCCFRTKFKLPRCRQAEEQETPQQAINVIVLGCYSSSSRLSCTLSGRRSVISPHLFSTWTDFCAPSGEWAKLAHPKQLILKIGFSKSFNEWFELSVLTKPR